MTDYIDMKVYKNILLITLIILILQGCGSNQIRSGIPPSFIEGLAAIDRKDFAAASYHFAELAKEGDPGSMNNLGVSLLMVDRKDEAIYWFKKASRYGDSNAKLTLKAMGEAIPPSDLVNRHPTQLQQEATNQFIVTTLLGFAAGVTAYYANHNIVNSHNYYLNNKFRSQSNTSNFMSKRDVTIVPDGSWSSEIPKKWVIEGNKDDLRVRPQYDYDYTHSYKGSIDSNGDIRLRNPYTGDYLRGNIDNEGYGRIRDIDGNSYRVKPKW